MRYYSPTTGCTYLRAIHGNSMPGDVIEISEDLYQTVIASPAPGMVRRHDAAGRPFLSDPPPPSPATRDQVEAQRLRAYADPLRGSDRYFAEAQRESLLGNAEAADAAKALGLARFAEIQAEYPWPAE